MKSLFVLSSPHGGSTFLGQLLGRNSEFANPGEVTFIPKNLALDVPCVCGDLLAECETWGRVFDELQRVTGVDLRKDPYGLFMGDAIRPTSGSAEIDAMVDFKQQTPLRIAVAKARGAIDTAMLLGAPGRTFMKSLTLPSIRRGLRNTHHLYEAIASQWDARVVVDVSKTLKKGPHLYLENPEQTRILHLTRDARSVCVSRMKYMSVDRAAERWDHYHRLARRFTERWVAPEHRMLMRYEDLALNPEENLRKLCDWLEVEFDPQMLDFSKELPSHAAGGNPRRFDFAAGIKRPEQLWGERFQPGDMEAFEKRAQALNAEFGYQ
jgi:hypothetical protein